MYITNVVISYPDVTSKISKVEVDKYPKTPKNSTQTYPKNPKISKKSILKKS